MAKEKHSDTGRPEKKHGHEPPQTSLVLKIGHWKNAFTEQQCKVMIAESLNLTVSESEFRHSITGYLITRRRVCLVLRIDPRRVRKMLHFFYEAMKKKIEGYSGIEHKIIPVDHSKRDHEESKQLQEPLFEEFPMLNHLLVKLITGKTVVLPYYSPHLERLKERIRNYPFCSAIDYSGAKSPVLVTVTE